MYDSLHIGAWGFPWRLVLGKACHETTRGRPYGNCCGSSFIRIRPDPFEEATLEASTQVVVDAIKRAGQPVVLVAHSMGGVVATQAVDRIATLVEHVFYVAAFRPLDGECLLDLATRTEFGEDGIQKNITFIGDPPVRGDFNISHAREVIYGDADEETATWATAQLQGQALALFATPVELGPRREVEVTYVVCAGDQAIPPGLQRHMASRRPARVIEIESDHSPFLSHPTELAAILDQRSSPPLVGFGGKDMT